MPEAASNMRPLAVLLLGVILTLTQLNAALGSIHCPVRFSATTPVDAQVALAMSAAPSEVAIRARVYVLTRRGFAIYRTGKNGFSCIVERERLDTVEPECFDAVGSASILQSRLFTESQRSKGITEAEVQQQIDSAYSVGRFKAPAKPGIVYMLSGCNRVFDPDANRVIAFPGHLMFYAPYMTAKDLGYLSSTTHLT